MTVATLIVGGELDPGWLTAWSGTIATYLLSVTVIETGARNCITEVVRLSAVEDGVLAAPQASLKTGRNKNLVYGGSALIAGLGIYWLIERIFL